MMNSRWQMNRIGLVDFWYYDEEEFWFQDGRMLLRGSNGSGKSVTMQSFIPLILDGNMRPERLDPFGSRARKMENYLLEEGDDREERTGYLYLELKRKEGSNYLTIGVGMRARRNKKLDTWYFYINDGRRIGTDLFLYKDIDAKIALSRQELKNRIGEGGRVMESQSEYMEAVNKLVFGFESIDKYKEMLDLLIQLRSPKLSKDFKPTVLNEILSNSLLMLSEDDLRPMSEAIENMDAIKTNLDTLKESLRASRQIEKAYDRYNQIVLYQKAEQYLGEVRQLKKCQQAAADCGNRLDVIGKEEKQQEEHYQQLQQEELVLKEQRDSLHASDAVRLKEQEEELIRQTEQMAQELGKKKEQEQDKEERFRQVSREIQKQEENNAQIWNQVEALLEEMEEEIEPLPFDEGAFLAKELKEAPGDAYDFSAHSQMLEQYMQKVSAGVQILKEEKQCQQRYDEQLKALDGLHMERDRAERERIQLERQLQEIKEELVENCYRWEKENQELKVEQPTMQELSRAIQQFEERSDYGEIREIVRGRFHVLEGQLRQKLYEAEADVKQAAQLLAEKQAEIDSVQAQKELCPDQPQAVQKNRRLLAERGIPFYHFYQTVDFDSRLNPQQAARLEEALLQMGILDALIIPAEYREQVLKLDEGVCDRYIFSDVKRVRDNVMEALDVDNPDQDILLHQLVAGVLCGIGFGGEESGPETWINHSGHYRLGILEGTITGKYEAQFIGARTREQSRQKRILQLQTEYESLCSKKAELDLAADKLRQRLSVLQQELARFPKGEDIHLAAKEYGNAAVKTERLEQAVADARQKAEALGRELTEVRMQVQEICGKAFLTARLDLFLEAEASLREYQKKLTQLIITHHSYRNGCAQIQSHRDFLDDLEASLDDIRYDLSGLKRKEQELSQRLQSVLEQMKLTNYEEIRETLEACMSRLAQIPAEKEAAAVERRRLQSELEQARRDQEQYELQKLQAAASAELYKSQFQQEYSLEYVERRFVVTEDMADQAQKVSRMLTGTFEGKSLNDYFGEVQSSYHMSRGYLLEYHLTMDYILDDGHGGKRIDLMGKYRGVSVKFKELIQKLEEDVQEQERLLGDKDRELFEDILANTISKKIRARIHESNAWVDKMNGLMGQMKTSSGLRLNLKWRSKRAEQEEQLDTRALVALLQKDAEIMREEEVEQLSRHFRSKIAEARKLSEQSGSVQSFHAIMREVLDYRKWFEFQLEYQKTGEPKRELTDRAFFTFSGGEKAMSMYVPLFSAAVAKYKGANSDAPRIISLDEAFAGVDEMNIQDMFRLMVDFEFDFIINSQILWGDYETVPALAIYQLVRPENAKFVSVISYIWNGKERMLAAPEEQNRWISS